MRVKAYQIKFLFGIGMLLLSFLLINTPIIAQKPARYWISFTDKKNIPYKISQPTKFLSAKALERRKKGSIYLTQEDLPVSRKYIDSISSLGLKFIVSSKWFNGALFEVPNESDIEKINNIPFVKKIEKRSNAIYYQKSFIKKWLPEADLFRLFDEPVIDYGMGYRPVEMLRSNVLHKMGFKGKGVVIAIIDAGFTSYNTAGVFDTLIQEKRILGYRDFVEPKNTNFNTNTHGTMVLGTMGAYSPGFYVGGAPEASYWLLRSEDGETEYPSEEDSWLAAIEFADSAGVDVVNTSLGYSDFDDSVYNHPIEKINGKTYRISIAAQMAAQRGMLLTISAGNSGRSEVPYIGVPADAFEVLTVGAVDKSEKFARFSSHGIGPVIKPDIVAQGTNIPAFDGNTWKAESASGTSFSSPVAGAAAACLIQAFPDKPISDIRNAIIANASNYSSPDFYYGYGIPNFEAAYQYLNDGFPKDVNYSVFPTIVTNFLYIQTSFSKKDKILIECFQLTGQKIFSAIKSEDILLTHELNQLHEGLYIFRCTSGSESISFKIIKKAD